jgi:hypothetical protein
MFKGLRRVIRFSKYIYIFETNKLTHWIVKLLGGELTVTVDISCLKSSYSSDLALIKTLENTQVFYEKAEESQSIQVNETSEFLLAKNIVLPSPKAFKAKENLDSPAEATKPGAKKGMPPKRISKYGPLEDSLETLWPDAHQGPSSNSPFAYKDTGHEISSAHNHSQVATDHKGENRNENKDRSQNLSSNLPQTSKDLTLKPEKDYLHSAELLPVIEENPEWTYGYDDHYKRKVLTVTVKMIEKMDHQDAADFMDTLDPIFADELLRGKEISPVVKGIVLSRKVGLGKVTLASFLESQKSFKEKSLAEKISGGKNGN